MFVVFSATGVPPSQVLVKVLLGRRWSGSSYQVGEVLSAYCIYLLVMAVNGVAEAFVFAVARKDKLPWINASLVLCTVLFAVIGPALIASHGAVGLVAANAITMSLRACGSIVFTVHYFAKEKGYFTLSRCVPRPPVLAAFAGAFAVMCWSDRTINVPARGVVGLVAHVALGVACLGAIAGLTWRLDRAFLRDMRELWKARRGGKSE